MTNQRIWNKTRCADGHWITCSSSLHWWKKYYPDQSRSYQCWHTHACTCTTVFNEFLSTGNESKNAHLLVDLRCRSGIIEIRKPLDTLALSISANQSAFTERMKACFSRAPESRPLSAELCKHQGERLALFSLLFCLLFISWQGELGNTFSWLWTAWPPEQRLHHFPVTNCTHISDWNSIYS